jgi:UDP-N-acetylglucosamine 4-epimerase
MTKYKILQEYLKDNQSTWLITGVAGFIGSNLLEHLLSLNQKVIGLDNFDTGYRDNMDHAIQDACQLAGKNLNLNFKFIEGDIRNISDCKQACKGVDYVLHHAAIGSVPRSIEDPIGTSEINIGGFLNMLIASRDAKVKRFVYAASSSTYGDSPDLPKVEDVIGNPLSPYAVTKLANELYANVFANSFNLQTIGLRYFNIFGKRQDPNGAYAAVIPKWVESILNREDVFINGDGKTTRDFCYIDNTIQMNLLAATTINSQAINQIYNVALNEKTSLNDLYQIIEEGIIKRVNGLEKKQPIYRDFRAGDIRHSQACIEKAKKLLGYQPEFNIANGMDAAIDWYVQESSK